MKKLLALTLAVAAIVISCCFLVCNKGDKYNRERFYGVVRFSESVNDLVVYIPSVGEVVIPESEECCSCFDGHEENDDKNYRLKVGDLIAINFRYEKSRNDNGVKIMETHPAKFDRNARLIEALRENITFEKTDSGYVLSFPTTSEIESAAVGDSLYFIRHGGENGRAYVKLYAEGKITAKENDIITVVLSVVESENEFLEYYSELTVELTRRD